MQPLDLNSDMGESTHLHHYDVADDVRLLSKISSTNIASGFHAGDPQTMQTLVDAAIENGVAIGAHPGYPDRKNFGREPLNLTEREIYNIILYQVGALNAFLTARDKRLHHVKPHGALYNTAAKEVRVAMAIARAIAALDTNVFFYGLSGSRMEEAATACGLRFVSEVFADRTYQTDGSLTARSQKNAMITSEACCREQLVDMALHKRIKTVTGNYIPIKAETVCLHSDGAHALKFATLINETLHAHGISIGSPKSAGFE